MASPKNNQIAVEQPGIQINDELKEQPGTSPLFPEKNAKAARIMALVRKQQQCIK